MFNHKICIRSSPETRSAQNSNYWAGPKAPYYKATGGGLGVKNYV